jgi:chromosome segregation ATPase
LNRAEASPPADPSLWEKLEAFRELLARGGRLLGEVMVFVRSAEEALVALEQEKARLDAQRRQLEQEKAALVEETARADMLASLEGRLRSVETELQHTRDTLSVERARRDRAISLIRPAPRVSEHQIHNRAP